VLNASHSSYLSLFGNSCSLADWAAKLGQHHTPFVAGLSSISVDGGVVPLMDVIIEKVFPVAFMHSQKGTWEPPWDEEEERIRQDTWKVGVASDYFNQSSTIRTSIRAKPLDFSKSRKCVWRKSKNSSHCWHPMLRSRLVNRTTVSRRAW
jgi:hypothetical protein